ncbi:MAG: hypothetical protein GTO45_23535 [Candidatus Aminicenantes bacterium]|nr:hypothetical protein [Candidatus Aminicenantes bacterium]NIM81731.1 hypothetical protein [Candidatus Aminicenantes bacterium]NIN21102.1 hypothetical protein [Candidatus Aminicenantes bacterium]NIN44924.1 hypothetical protein [Candidatus Aminicenantes bacterium]NIN87738.1 hypothetical protein [Candidatus Aminicenantes bacterium]
MKLEVKVSVILVFILISGWLVIPGLEQDTAGTSGSDEQETWVCLESITFNHDPVYSSSDAINIRKNRMELVKIPEWTKEGASYPAAYIRNKSITVKAVFSASADVESAEIKAVTLRGSLGDILPRTVFFKDGASNPVHFQVSTPAPREIKSFDQEWKWSIQDLNYMDSSQEPIGNSINKIYIVLSEPQCPWTTRGPTEPWTDVLNYACAWADGETTPEGAAEKITHHLYNDLGGSYQQEGSNYTGSTSESFDLTDFLDSIPDIGTVNCHDMGKALAAFSNVVGCALNYRISDPFGDNLHCIKPIGKDSWCCSKEFANHAFGSIGDNIFDACLKADVGRDPDQQPNIPGWMTNILWEDYKEKVVKEGEPFYPKAYSFGIDGMPLEINEGFYRKCLQWVKEKYDFANWGSETEKVIPGLAISEKTLPQLSGLEKAWKEDHYRIIKIRETAFLVMRQWWKADDRQFDVKMVVCPTFAAAKRCLIFHYADTTRKTPLIKPPGRKFGLDMGNLCFVMPEKTAAPGRDGNFSYAFSSIDFIRHNVLFMMRAEGSLKKELGTMAGILDNHLLEKKPVTTYSQLKDIPLITRFSCERIDIKRGESVPLLLEVSNTGKRELHYSWRMTGGGIEKDANGNFLYYGGDVGSQTITVTVLNDLGLYSSKSLEVKVKSNQCIF